MADDDIDDLWAAPINLRPRAPTCPLQSLPSPTTLCAERDLSCNQSRGSKLPVTKNPDQPSGGFFQIPAEIRLQIYDLVFNDPSAVKRKVYSALLRTNKQIRKEALPQFTKWNPYTFHSIQNFISWTCSQSHTDILPCVRDVTLSCDYDTLRTIVRESANAITPIQTVLTPPVDSARVGAAVTPSPLSSPYYALSRTSSGNSTTSSTISSASSTGSSTPTYESLTDSLQSLTGLTTLTICFPDRMRIPFGAGVRVIYQQLEEDSLDLILSTVSPTLTSLSLFALPVPLDVLRHPNLRNLHHLCFYGSTTSMAQEALAALRSLPNLKQLDIEGYDGWMGGSAIVRSTHNNRFNTTLNHNPLIVLSPSLVSRLRPLHAFRLTRHACLRSPFVTAPMMRALSTHKDSLRELVLEWRDEIGLLGRRVVNEETWEEMGKLVRGCERLEKLRLEFGISKEKRAAAREEVKAWVVGLAGRCGEGVDVSVDFGDL